MTTDLGRCQGEHAGIRCHLICAFRKPEHSDLAGRVRIAVHGIVVALVLGTELVVLKQHKLHRIIAWFPIRELIETVVVCGGGLKHSHLDIIQVRRIRIHQFHFDTGNACLSRILDPILVFIKPDIVADGDGPFAIAEIHIRLVRSLISEIGDRIRFIVQL